MIKCEIVYKLKVFQSWLRTCEFHLTDISDGCHMQADVFLAPQIDAGVARFRIDMVIFFSFLFFSCDSWTHGITIYASTNILHISISVKLFSCSLCVRLDAIVITKPCFYFSILLMQIHDSQVFFLFLIFQTEYPRLARAHAAYSELPAFQAALPERQPDYPASA